MTVLRLLADTLPQGPPAWHPASHLRTYVGWGVATVVLVLLFVLGWGLSKYGKL